MVPLNSEIEAKLIKGGACLVGFADISELAADVRSSMKFAISIAVALDASIIKEIRHGPTRCYYDEYNKANKLLADLAANTANYLKRNDNDALVVEPTVKELDIETLATLLPHKTVATRAGLGWVGKSALLITKKYGSAVRLATVLTDAHLEVAEPIENCHCDDCNACVVHCPVRALSGKKWLPGCERKEIVDAFNCHSNTIQLCKQIGLAATICGICINVCPWTQKYISRENSD